MAAAAAEAVYLGWGLPQYEGYTRPSFALCVRLWFVQCVCNCHDDIVVLALRQS